MTSIKKKILSGVTVERIFAIYFIVITLAYVIWRAVVFTQRLQ